MKTKTSILQIIALIGLNSCCLGIRDGCAAVVSQAVQIFQYPPPHSGPLGSDAEVSPNVPGCGGWIQYLALEADGKLKMVIGTVGNVYAWFTVSQGERLDAALVLGNPPFGTRGPHSIFFEDVLTPTPDGTWLVGWWSMDRSLAYDPGPNDCYGWLRLSVSDGILIIAEDAAEVGGAGIYAGTLISVPEPAAGTSAVLGLLAAAGRRSRARSRKFGGISS